MTVDVVVLDERGRPVRGLRREDFVLLEDGRPRPIAAFEPVRADPPAGWTPRRDALDKVATSGPYPDNEGASFVILVDEGSLAPSSIARVRSALLPLLSQGMRDGDAVILATSSGSLWWYARIPEGREDLVALLARVRGRKPPEAGKDGISDWEAYRIVHAEGRDAGTSLTEGALRAAMASPAPGPAVATTVDRIMERFYRQRVCNPDPVPPPSGPPATALSVCRSMVVGRAEMVDRARINRTLDLTTTIGNAVFALGEERGRKSLVLLTEGLLNDNATELTRDLTARCQEANVAVYVVDVRGLSAGLPGAELGSPDEGGSALQLEASGSRTAGALLLAESTGGFAVLNSNDLAGAVGRITGESRNYYMLGFVPTAGKGPQEWRKLEVNVANVGLTARTRPGYALRTSVERLASAEVGLRETRRRSRRSDLGGSNAGDPAPVPLPIARELLRGRARNEIPLRAMAYALEDRPGGVVRAVLGLEIDTRRLADLGDEGRPRAGLSLSISVAQRDSPKVVRTNEQIDVELAKSSNPEAWGGWLLLNRAFDLSPGVAQARVVVRDEFLGRLGAVTLRFTVPRADEVRIGTPLLSQILTREAGGDRPHPAIVARREFSPSGRLYCEFGVFGLAVASGRADVLASYELRRQGGALVSRADPTTMAPDAGGRPSTLFSFVLDGLDPGGYELLLRVHDVTGVLLADLREEFRVRWPAE